MSKYVIVSFVDEVVVGQVFNKTKWPLHLTLVQPFLSEKGDDFLIEQIITIANGHEQFPMLAKAEEKFGQNNDILVVELEMNPEAQKLNTDLVDVLKSFIVKDSFEYPNYRPHITKNGTNAIKVGDSVIVNNISLVKYKEDDREIISDQKL